MARVTSRSDRILIALLALFGGARVGLLAAALPFWNNVDEREHADMVMRYSACQVPTKMELYGPESASLFIACDCKEYILTREMAARYHPPESAWREIYNPDSEQPPFYYIVAGAWYRLGRALGLEGCASLRWIRALNGAVFALLILVAASLTRRFHPGDRFMGLAVPLLLAAMPLDAFYSINSDVPSALLCASVLLLLPAGAAPPGRWAGAGLLAAAAVLTKYSNFIVLAGGAVAGWMAWNGTKKRKPVVRGLILAAVAAALPVIVWLARNAVVLGDPLGMRGKLAWLGWTPRSLGAFADHPMFTLKGALYFIGETIRRAWRGEMVWHGHSLGWPAMDSWYIWSTLIFLAAAALAAFRRGRRAGDIVNWAVLLAGVGFLIWSSLAWDFGNCPYPSRHLPFMVSARLVSGALVPFLMLYVRGFGTLCPPGWKFRTRLFLIAIIAIMMLVSDLFIRWPALSIYS